MNGHHPEENKSSLVIARTLRPSKAKLATQRLTETDAEIVPLIEKIGATSTGEIEKLIIGMQRRKTGATWRDSIKTLEILRRNQTDPLPARN